MCFSAENDVVMARFVFLHKLSAQCRYKCPLQTINKSEQCQGYALTSTDY